MGRSKILDESTEGAPCQHRRCQRGNAQPIMTKKYTEWTNKDTQPKFYCNKHVGLYDQVSALTGEVIVRHTKKEVKKSGKKAA